MVADPVPTFAVALRRYRLAAGLTQEALAERAGLSVEAIGALERGARTTPRRDTIDRLAEALGLGPDDRARLAATAPRARSTASQPSECPRHNLPAALTSFVGRERELAEVARLLEQSRLVTLIGPGGCGKTRLALEVAAQVMARYFNGVWLVDLAPLADPALVVHAVGRALAVPARSGQPVLTTLRAALAGRELLLMLDNCEHLLDACASLAVALLRGCPHLAILATSREPLGVPAERTWPVLPLRTPSDTDRDAAAIASVEAVRLFLERALAARPGFALAAGNALAIAELCRRLDGLPLAIELAAARVRVVPVVELTSRLGDRFRLLTAGDRTALPRHQTLGATLDWSYDLLTEPERALFRHLAVFAGGWTLRAAEAVASGEGSAPAAVLDLLARLADKSLIQTDEQADGSARYRLLETLRAYASERLEEAGEAEAARRNHAAYFLAVAEDAVSRLQGRDQTVWLQRLDRERDNLREALAWASERGDAELGGRLAACLWRFWYYHGYPAEGRALLTAALSRTAGDKLALRAALLDGRAVLALHQGDYAAARADTEAALVVARQSGDPGLLPRLVDVVGFTALVQEDYAAARPLLAEALTLARQQGDTLNTAYSLHHIGLLALEADGAFELAAERNHQSLALFRELGHGHMIGAVLCVLGQVARARGDAARAHALLAEAATTLGTADLALLPRVLTTWAALFADAGQVERAVILAAAAAHLYDITGSQLWPSSRRDRDAWLVPFRRALGDDAFARLWANGQALTAGQAVAAALEQEFA